MPSTGRFIYLHIYPCLNLLKFKTSFHWVLSETARHLETVKCLQCCCYMVSTRERQNLDSKRVEKSETPDIYLFLQTPFLTFQTSYCFINTFCLINCFAVVIELPPDHLSVFTQSHPSDTVTFSFQTD